MSVLEDQGANRLPHQRPIRPSASHTIPFYRDIRVLRIIVQIAFAIMFIGTLAAVWVSLTGNLQESQIALDFEVYKRRFGAPLSEGMLDHNLEWTWVKDFDEVARSGIA